MNPSTLNARKVVLVLFLFSLFYQPIVYSANTPASTMAYKILKRGQGLSFSEQITEPNTIYEISSSFDLSGKNVTIPEGCVLKFNGGSINNGTLIGQNTVIESGIVPILGRDVSFRGEWNIKEVFSEWFGAVGTGEIDDSAPIQKALLLASISTGQKVSLLGRNYLVNTQIDVPNSVEIHGVYSKNDTSLDRATVIVCSNRAINNQKDGLIRLGGGVFLHDLKFWYPKQTGFNSEKTVIVYSPSILVKENSNYVTIERIAFAGSYIGIRAEMHKNLTINDCIGFCFKYGIYDIASHDIDRICNCHFNFNYLFQNSSYAKAHPWPKGAGTLYKYSFQNSTTAFKIGRCDWIVLSNCFAFGYQKGFEIGSTNDANYNFNMIGGGADSCKEGILLINCHFAHITDVTITHGDSWGASADVKIRDRQGVGIKICRCTDIKMENVTHQFGRGYHLYLQNSSHIDVSNSSYIATNSNTKDDWGVIVEGNCSFTLTNCVFSGWGTNSKLYEGGGLGCVAVIYDKKCSILGSVNNCRFESCSTLCTIEGGDGAATNTHYILQSNNSYDSLLNRQALARMRNADINYGTTQKRIILSNNGVWNCRVDGEYWDVDLQKPVFWTGSKWVDSDGCDI